MSSGKKLIFPLIFSFFLSFNVSASPTDVSSAVQNETIVVPGGKSIGVTLSTDGVVVVDLSDLEETGGDKSSPAEDAGLKPGDIIKFFNEEEISCVDDLTDAINSSGGNPCSVTISRNNRCIKSSIHPKVTKNDSAPKIGAWVKDAASGIGTLTFYNPETKFFGALGHGICDPDTGELVAINQGSLYNSTIVSVDKGKKGAPGELKGMFSEDDTLLGEIKSNNLCGISGTVEEDFSLPNTPVPIGNPKEVTVGKAYILANIKGNIIEKYDIEITRIISQNRSTSKNMIIKITDSALINETGGIVQGMSGCPIIQNGKLIGAITHVFVNDPTRGYAIFAENMLSNSR